MASLALSHPSRTVCEMINRRGIGGGGPGFDTGPVANSRFMAWVSAEQVPDMTPEMANLILSAEDGEPIGPYF
ncbi:hypothetical protein JKL49_05335 [Phenylobacterium sp. 20VBR1]|uniref:Uncharacterized protein n=1 Tax=Phenylobacterium glaciei TaxID=2803784 RepID=A0A941D0W9_9CAUL|nr:hypothetical protein [Phenylobacterium glaciei]MBR7618806.1 hypothetical protein [Phenylobacterium glaciei]